MSTWGGGLVIIHSDNTTTVYNTTSTPSLPDNDVPHSWKDTNGDVYVSTWGGGLVIIHSDNTTTVYNTASTPSLPGNDVPHSWKDTNGDVYVGTSGGGLAIIHSDNTTTVYNTSSTPALPGNNAPHSWKDTNGDVYVGTSGGLAIIHSDNTTTVYNTSSTPALPYNDVRHSWKDTNGDVYVGTSGGNLTIIHSDNTTTIYNTTSSPPLPNSNYIYHSWKDTNGDIYVSNVWTGGLVIIHSSSYALSGSFNGPIIDVGSTVDFNTVNWTEDLPSGSDATFQTRTSSTFWQDDFDDGDISNVDGGSILTLAFGWGGVFQNISEENGILTFSNATTDDVPPQIDTGYPADYFPAGSIVRARIKMTTDTTDPWFGMFTDEWDNGEAETYVINNWIEISYTETTAFNKIGFDVYGFTDLVNDQFQIDWVRIESPADWSVWSSTVSDPSGNTITSPAGRYIQYKANLSTGDSALTPTISDVTIDTLYYPGTSGNLVSSDIEPTKLEGWNEFSWNDTEPENTDLKYHVYYYNTTTSEWIMIPDADLTGNSTGFDTSPVDISGLNVLTYPKLRVRADLSSSSSSATPILSDWTVTWNTTPIAPTLNSVSSNSSVSLTANITDNSYTENTLFLYISTSSNPTTENGSAISTTSGTSSSTYDISNLTDLSSGTIYYIRSRSQRTSDSVYSSYSNELSFCLNCGSGLPPSASNPPAQPEPTPENPEGGFSVLINNNDEYTDDETVILKLSAGKDTKRMAISNTEDFKYASQIPYQEEYQWELSSGRDEAVPRLYDGEYTVYAKFYTQYGVASEVVSDSIILKTAVTETEETTNTETEEQIEDTNQEPVSEIENKDSESPNDSEPDKDITVEDNKSAVIIFTKALSSGSNNDQVTNLQNKLKELNFFPKEIKSNGNFGSATKQAVKEYQISKEIYPCGIVGPRTRKALNSEEFITNKDYKFTQDLKYNDKNEEVKQLQTRLRDQNFFPYNIESTGWFGSVTQGAVNIFQKFYGLVQSGVVDEEMRGVLNK